MSLGDGQGGGMALQCTTKAGRHFHVLYLPSSHLHFDHQPASRQKSLWINLMRAHKGARAHTHSHFTHDFPELCLSLSHTHTHPPAVRPTQCLLSSPHLQGPSDNFTLSQAAKTLWRTLPGARPPFHTCLSRCFKVPFPQVCAESGGGGP